MRLDANMLSARDSDLTPGLGSDPLSAVGVRPGEKPNPDKPTTVGAANGSSAVPGRPPLNGTRRGRVVAAILQRIFSGELAGGDRLVEEELAERLGVSRTPIREALSELAAIGVIWLKPNHGAMVRPFGPKQLREIYQIRRVLECEAARCADALIDRAELQRIRDGLTSYLDTPPEQRPPGWGEQALALDQRLHELIARSSGSERLAEEIHRYWTLALSIGEAVGNVAQTRDHALSEHIRIIDALLAHRRDEAAEAMNEHLIRREEAALEALSPNLKRA